MMRKILLPVAALLALTGCNEELGPEYSTGAVFGQVTVVPTTVTADDTVSVEVSVTSGYGITSAWVVYYLNGDMNTAKASKQTFFKGESQTSATYKGQSVIPKQVAGTKVTFQIAAQTPYGVISVSQTVEYTVTEGSGELPVDPTPAM